MYFGICGLAALLVCALLLCRDFVGFLRKFGLSCSVAVKLKKIVLLRQHILDGVSAPCGSSIIDVGLN